MKNIFYIRKKAWKERLKTSRVFGFGFAGLVIILATFIRSVVDIHIGDELPYAFFYMAVLLTIWLCGVKPAIVVMTAGFLVANWFFVEPRHSLRILTGTDVMGAVVYFINNLGFIILAQSLGSAKNHAEVNARIAEDRRKELENLMVECREVEESLRKSERIYRAIGESINYGVWVCTPDGRNIYSSDSFLRLVGMTQDQCLDFGWTEVLHPEDKEKTLSTWNECVSTGGRWDREHRFRGLDGEWHGVLSRGVAVYDEQGRVLCWAGINLDIERLKRVEEALRQANERLELAQNAAQAGTWEINLKTGEFQWSAKMFELLGLDPSQNKASAEVWKKAVHPEDREIAWGRLQEAVRQHKSLANEYRVSRQDGQVRWINSYGKAEYDVDGKPLRIAGIAMDVTERKQIEEQLRESQERFEAAVAGANDGVWDRDLRTGKVFFSDHWKAMLGYKPQQIENSYKAFESFVHPDDVQRMRDELEAHLRGDTPIYMTEFRMRHRNGQWRWILSRGTASRDAAGTPFRLAGSHTDITERKQILEALTSAKQQLRAYADKLETTVEERTAKLQEMVSELEHFSYAITHDMRAPLRSMQGFAQLLLQDESAKCLSPTAQDFLRRISTAANRMDHLITDALQFSRTLRAEYALNPVDVAALLQGMLHSYPNLQGPGVEIKLKGDFPLVRGNEAGLTQCFSNLLENGVKFVAPDVKPVVRIRAEMRGSGSPEASQVPEAIKSENSTGSGSGTRMVRIWVEDNGIGIPADAQEKIFVMFQQLDRKYPGTGIGLAIVRKTMQRMGGSVGVQSEHGKGSRFWLELAAAEQVD